MNMVRVIMIVRLMLFDRAVAFDGPVAAVARIVPVDVHIISRFLKRDQFV